MQERFKRAAGGAVLNLKRDETQGWHDSAAQAQRRGSRMREARGRRGGVVVCVCVCVVCALWARTVQDNTQDKTREDWTGLDRIGPKGQRVRTGSLLGRQVGWW